MEMVVWSNPPPNLAFLVPRFAVLALVAVSLLWLNFLSTFLEDAAAVTDLIAAVMGVFGAFLGFFFFEYFLPMAGWKAKLGLAATVLLAVSTHYLGLYFSRRREVNRWTRYDLVHVFLVRPGRICSGQRESRRDPDGRLHCGTGPALVYADGWAEYFWHGVRVPKSVITQPKRITVKRIMKEANTGIRQAMITRYGNERLMRDLGAREIDRSSNHGARLLAASFPGTLAEIRMMELTCPTTGRKYMEPVPPMIESTVEGLAWRFGVKPSQYSPRWQT